jgi:hypothetical protein
MTQFMARNPSVEVNGETVLSVVSGMELFRNNAIAILKRNHIANPEPGKWYKQQDWLDAFKDISEKVGESTLNNVGKKIPENAQWPPEIDNIDMGLSSIDVAYHMNHRNGDIGSYQYLKTGDRSAVMMCDNPYPCAFDKGIIQAVAKRFAPSDAVVHVDHKSKDCRNRGGQSCAYEVTW